MKKVGDRGLVEFSSFKDSYGSHVRVQSSSSAQPRVWIFCHAAKDESDFAPHLSRHQARLLINGLRKWLWYEFRETE